MQFHVQKEENRQSIERKDLRHIEDVIKTSEGNIAGKKQEVVSELNQIEGPHEIDSGSALQMFLDHIAINSIPGIRNSPVVEVNSDDCLRDAINLLYKKNVSGAPIADALEDAGARKFADRYIGFIGFARMVLWTLEECDRTEAEAETIRQIREKTDAKGLFGMLEHIPHIGQTKVGELAKSFLWDPFFPVHAEDTLFHVLLLLSKHQLQLLPVIEKSDLRVIGFVTQIAVVQLLLQSSGLEWFDAIAEKPLSEFRLEKDGCPAHIYGDQSVPEAFHSIWQNQVDTIPVINRETKKLIGSVRMNDVQLLLKDDELFHNRRNVTVEELISQDASKGGSNIDPSIDKNLGALLSAGILCLKNEFIPRMNSVVTNKKTDTLKQAMNVMVESQSNHSFLINESRQLIGEVTIRDVIMQFSPPSVESRIDGGGFFQSALEQTGCHVENGRVVHDA